MTRTTQHLKHFQPHPGDETHMPGTTGPLLYHTEPSEQIHDFRPSVHTLQVVLNEDGCFSTRQLTEQVVCQVWRYQKSTQTAWSCRHSAIRKTQLLRGTPKCYLQNASPRNTEGPFWLWGLPTRNPSQWKSLYPLYLVRLLLLICLITKPLTVPFVVRQEGKHHGLSSFTSGTISIRISIPQDSTWIASHQRSSPDCICSPFLLRLILKRH